ncbi:MAG: O-antigen ligase family protein [Armatimonadota bacterium]|nr:O-antigen ligase family protein [Armatimonadota bacterium]MDR7467006.1 O-antigen ligase family protein [Armatimonadota bacterium]MDR7493452.1 O-antigen ligase family protein [Armatimonadota bacterium]MDR7498717.1 O-antigen ligase family protein [Armatimonadota bacterium]MDR7503893.1 O-antigen ligase family protein [Armatimonadota bacterium]
MADNLTTRVVPGWRTRQFSARLAAPWWLGSVVTVAVLFRLAIGDGGREPFGLAMAQITVLLLLALLVWTGRARLSPAAWSGLFMLAVMAVTSPTSVRPEASVRQILLWAMYIGIAVTTGSTLLTPQAARRATDALVAIAGALVLYGLFIFWGAGDPRMRWYATFYWPNPFAGFLLLVVPVELLRCLRARAAREALAHGTMAALLLVALLFTYSRGAWLSLAAVLPVVGIVLRPSSWWQAARRLAVVGAAVVAVTVGLAGAAGARATVAGIAGRASSTADVGDYSIRGRLHFWRAALAIFRDHPVLGTGPGTFGAVHAAYQRDSRYYARDAHNFYLQAAAEMGILGFLSTIAVVAGILLTWLGSLAVTRGTESYAVAVGLGVGLIAFFAHSAVDMDWMFPAAPAAAWASTGILSALVTRGSVPTSRRVRPGVLGLRLVVVIGLLLAALVAQSISVAHRKFVDGHSFARRHQWDRAVQAYLAAAHWNPLNAGYHAAAAVALIQSDPINPAPAETHLWRAMALDSRNAAHPLDLARLILQSHGAERRYAEIEELLLRSLSLDPANRPDAYRLLASVYLAQGRSDEAGKVYRQAGEQYLGKGLSQGVLYMLLWPQAASLLQEWAVWEERQGEREVAETVLLRLLQEDPARLPAYLQLSTLYRRMGRRGAAERVVLQGLTIVPSGEDLWGGWQALSGRQAHTHER